MNTIDSTTLAKYVLAKLGEMPHLKLQKILYYIEAWHLAILDCELIPDKFEAWMHGPVLRNIWHHYRDYGMKTLNNLVYIDECEKDIVKKNVEQSLTQDQVELIKDVLDEYGDKSAYHLECLTHRELPWVEARREIEPAEKCSNEISKPIMKEYYRRLLYQQ